MVAFFRSIAGMMTSTSTSMMTIAMTIRDHHLPLLPTITTSRHHRLAPSPPAHRPTIAPPPSTTTRPADIFAVSEMGAVMDLVKERATTLFDAHRLLELSVAEYELIGMQRVAQLRLTKLKVINESTN